MPSARDQTAANRRYYQEHRAEEIQRVRERQARTQRFLAVLKSRPCADCGVQYKPHQMDFDHRDPSTKTFWLSRGTALLAQHDRLMAEVAKCDVVCANCHRTHPDGASFPAGQSRVVGNLAAHRVPATSVAQRCAVS